MEINTKFDIGDLVYDKITGFEGVVINISISVTKSIQYVVAPQNRNEIMLTVWIDEIRLKLKRKNEIKFYENNKSNLRPIK